MSSSIPVFQNLASPPCDWMQEDVFAKIGRGAVANVLDGYNSTVFAYGQTGSGKTFTITGGAERLVRSPWPLKSELLGVFTE